MKLALAQTNPTIGDIDGNTTRILAAIEQAAAGGAELVIFPEQAVIGYPAKDLLLRREFIDRNVAALQRITARSTRIAVLLGYAEPNNQAYGRPVFNTAALLAEGRVLARRRKRLLPTYDVFDEARYFEPGSDRPEAGPTTAAAEATGQRPVLQPPLVELHGRRLGLTICEDLLSQDMFGRPLYRADPVRELANAGADLLINISASPFFLDKHAWRIGVMAGRAREHGLPLAYVNQVGGNDELLFDGASCLITADGRVAAQARSFGEDLLLIDLDHPDAARIEPVPAAVVGLFEALVMGLRDYVRKCAFEHVVLGLSGGIDSSVVAVLAVEALGADNVHGIAMPGRHSSAHSITDARALAKNLGIRFSLVEIEPMHAAFEAALAPRLGGGPLDVTAENIQARVRGVILMAFSNKFGSLLLTTGNKSEVAVGYCTLYGDMAGGLAVISDVPKTMVYALARHINERAGRELIPQNTIDKPPSAELRPNQTDQDTLPPYEALDAILERYEEQLESRSEIIAAGYDPRTVADVIHKIQISEYKRQQAAPGLKVTSRAFGFGRRMPIAAKLPR